MESLDADFPYRKQFMPSFKEMFGRILETASNPPKEWFKTEKKQSNNYGTVIRTYPKDYELTDSLADHFVEPFRILCREIDHISPLDAWIQLKSQINPKLSIREKRELVYKQARGCNLYNPSLGAYVLKTLSEHNKNLSVLDCTAGWGDRLISTYAIPNITRYTGYDTNPKLQASYNQISDACSQIVNHKLDVSIICKPFELETAYFKPNGNGYQKYDIVFTSPPFYNQELYQGEYTSTNLYKTRDSWNQKFYIPMLINAQNALKPGGWMALYIAPHMLPLTQKTLINMKYKGTIGFKMIYDDFPAKPRYTYLWQSDSNH